MRFRFHKKYPGGRCCREDYHRKGPFPGSVEDMSRHNLAFLTGAILKAPLIEKDDEGNTLYGWCTIRVVRGFRDVGDHKNFMKSDNPIIMTRDMNVLREMETWKENDVVYIKGVVASKSIGKTNYCQHCGARNIAEGTLVYVNPIFAVRMGEFKTEDEALHYLSGMREISNQVFLLGTLCRDPKKITPKEGLIVTQYQIALNRKYFIRSDPPSIKADYPWVKSYGENAIEDKKRLHTGTKVFIDGCLQARSVQKHAVCCVCGKPYDWKDRAMEIVPYETEYICDYYSDEEIAVKEKEEAKNAFASIFGKTPEPAEAEDTNDDVNDLDF